MEAIRSPPILMPLTDDDQPLAWMIDGAVIKWICVYSPD